MWLQPNFLLVKSGKIDQMKSAMLSSFMFFGHTVALLGKDTGYFLGKEFVQSDGQRLYQEAMELASSWLSIDLKSSDVDSMDCPVATDAYIRFYKTALMKPSLAIVGIFFWHFGVYALSVRCGLYYHVKRLINRYRVDWYPHYHWEWTHPIRIIMRTLVEGESEDEAVENITKHGKELMERGGLVTYEPCEMEGYMWEVKTEQVSGADAVFTNFHSCSVLFRTARKVHKAQLHALCMKNDSLSSTVRQMHRDGLIGEKKGLRAYKKAMKLLGVDLHAAPADPAAVVKIEDLPDTKVQELLQAFELFDRDGSGAIDQQELGYVMRSLGQNPTEEELVSIISKADTDGDGQMEFVEFVNYASKLMAEGDNEASLRESFRIFDDDESGVIGPPELRKVM